MKSNAFVLSLVSALTCSWLAAAHGFAADSAPKGERASDPKVTTTSENLQSGVTCFMLEQPADFCAIVGKPIVNYVHPAFNVIDLNGAWAGPGGETPYIYLYGDPQYSAGYTIAIDMSLLNRPDAFGYVVDESTIAVVFPDDRDYTGTIVGGTIHWSNNTVWTKR